MRHIWQRGFSTFTNKCIEYWKSRILYCNNIMKGVKWNFCTSLLLSDLYDWIHQWNNQELVQQILSHKVTGRRIRTNDKILRQVLHCSEKYEVDNETHNSTDADISSVNTRCTLVMNGKNSSSEYYPSSSLQNYGYHLRTILFLTLVLPIFDTRVPFALDAI